jgi:hypothetical protein
MNEPRCGLRGLLTHTGRNSAGFAFADTPTAKSRRSNRSSESEATGVVGASTSAGALK